MVAARASNFQRKLRALVWELRGYSTFELQTLAFVAGAHLAFPPNFGLVLGWVSLPVSGLRLKGLRCDRPLLVQGCFLMLECVLVVWLCVLPVLAALPCQWHLGCASHKDLYSRGHFLAQALVDSFFGSSPAPFRLLGFLHTS